MSTRSFQITLSRSLSMNDPRTELESLLSTCLDETPPGETTVSRITELVGSVDNPDELMRIWEKVVNVSELNAMVIDRFRVVLDQSFDLRFINRLVRLRNRAPKESILETTISDHILSLIADEKNLDMLLKVYENLSDDTTRQDQVKVSIQAILDTYDDTNVDALVDIWTSLPETSASQRLVGHQIAAILNEMEDGDKMIEVWRRIQHNGYWRKHFQARIKLLADGVTGHSIPKGIGKILRNRNFILREAGDFLGNTLRKKVGEIKDGMKD